MRAAKLLAATTLILAGLTLIVFGNLWASQTFDFLPDNEFGFWLELFVPFLPMAFIGFGAMIYVSNYHEH